MVKMGTKRDRERELKVVKEGLREEDKRPFLDQKYEQDTDCHRV